MSDTIGLPPIDKRSNKKPSNLKKSIISGEPKFVSFEDQFKRDQKEEKAFENFNENRSTANKRLRARNNSSKQPVEKKSITVIGKGAGQTADFQAFMQSKAENRLEIKKDDHRKRKSEIHSLSGTKSQFNSRLDVVSTTDSIGAKSSLSSGKLEILKNNLAKKQRENMVNLESKTASPIADKIVMDRFAMSPINYQKYDFECHFCLQNKIADPNQLKCGHVVCGDCISIIDGINGLKVGDEEENKFKCLECFYVTRKQELIPITTPAKDENILNVNIDLEDDEANPNIEEDKTPSDNPAKERGSNLSRKNKSDKNIKHFEHLK